MNKIHLQGTPLSVLSLEDSKSDFEIMCELLTDAGFNLQIDRIETENDFIARLRSKTYDIILADFNLPGFDAFKALELSRTLAPDIPFLCVSGAIGEETAAELIKKGAVDYILKNKPKRLPLAVQRAIADALEIKKRKQIEEKLRQSEHNLLEAERIGKVGGWEFDIDTGKQTWTEEVYKIHEVDITFEPTVESGINFYSPNSRPIIERAVERAIKFGEQFDVDLDIITTKGNLRSVHAIGNADLKHRRVYGFFQDITERKRAERKLEEHSIKWQHTFDAIKDSVFLLGLNGNILQANKISQSLFGKTENEIVGKQCYEIIHKTDCHIENCPFTRMKISKTRETMQLAMNNRWLEVVVDPMIDSDNNVIGAVHVVSDITERRQAEEQLKSQHALLLALINSPNDVIIFSLDKNYCYTAFNEKHRLEMKRVWNTDIAIGMNMLNCMVLPELQVLAKQSMDRALQGEEFTEIQCQPEPEIYYEFSWNPIRAGQNIVGLTVFIKDITERKHSEEKIVFSEKRFRAIWEASFDGMRLIDKNGMIVMVNSVFCKQVDKTREELENHSFEITYAIDEGKRILSAALERFRTRTVSPAIETELTLWNERRVWFSLSNSYLEFDTGEQFLLSIFRDITERKKVEIELQKSEETLRLAINATADGIWDWDLKNNSEYFSPRWCEIIGFSCDDPFFSHTFNSWASRIHADDKEYVTTALKCHLESGSVYDVEYRHLHKSGEYRWQKSLGKAIFDENNKPVRMIGCIRDIKERKRSEEKLLQLVRATEQSPVSIVITDTAGSIQYVNPKFVEVTGYTSEEAMGKNPRILKSGETSSKEYEKLWKVLTSGCTWQGELHNKKKNGELYWEYAKISPIVNAQGETTHFLAVKEDITERKKSEEAVRNAQKLESIGTLAGGIAHDFNNLLGAIMGQSSLALSKLPKGSSAIGNITKAITASEHAADLTRQLLAYSGRGKFNTIEIDLNTLVNENIQILEVSIPKSVQLKFELDSHSPRIYGDVGQIQQVIMNLIINAGDAIGAKSGYIKLRTGRIEITQNNNEFWKYTNIPLATGSYALLQVKDTGSGIDQEKLSRIFDPFFTTKFTGRGLGLSAVLGIIKGHKGGLRIESEVGKGTLFEIVLPLVNSAALNTVQEISENILIDGSGKTILIIDDDPFMFELMEDVLSEVHFNVIGALDPLKGIELYRRDYQNISMIILDYSMPSMDGKTTFEELLKINSDVKVLLSSGFTEEETMSTFETKRPSGFFQKPYKQDDLLQRLGKILSKEN